MKDANPNAVHIDEIIYDGQTEQGVELDYVLPDYCPDIFKILSCTLTPGITSRNITSDGKLALDGIVYIKVLYLAENSSEVHCIDQRYTYSKLIELTRTPLSDAKPLIAIQTKSDYCNCRAASPRRLDVRGAVSCRIKAMISSEYSLPEIPESLQVRRQEIQCCGETIFAEKTLVVREEIETGSAGIAFIMQSDIVPTVTDLRVIADKAVLKGTITVNALYGLSDPNTNGCSETEKMSADIPVSAILDINGITDSHKTFAEICVLNSEFLSKSDSGLISCELVIMCRVRGQLEKKALIATDVYSTDYETEFTSDILKLSANPRNISQSLTVRSTVENDKGEIGSVWDVSSELKNSVCRPDSNGELTLSGQLCIHALGTTTDGTPFSVEKQEAVEQTVTAADASPDTAVDYSACVTNTSYSIKSDGTLDISSAISLTANLRNICAVEAINSVTVNEDSPKEKSDEYALRICYTNTPTDCWNIAKRYNTTVKAIMEENEMEDSADCDTALSGMIIIPTV